MNFADIFINKYNVIVGSVVALLSYLLGEHWVLFTAYMVLNVVDWFTGWIRSRLKGTESSKAGLVGIIKKFGYWVIIGMSFGMSIIFIEIGSVLGIDLKVTSLLGWITLATLIINEIRSILENLVEAGYDVPVVLTKGLAVASKIITDQGSDDTDEETSDTPKNA